MTLKKSCDQGNVRKNGNFNSSFVKFLILRKHLDIGVNLFKFWFNTNNVLFQVWLHFFNMGFLTFFCTWTHPNFLKIFIFLKEHF